MKTREHGARIGFRLRPAERDVVELASTVEGCSMSAFVRRAVVECARELLLLSVPVLGDLGDDRVGEVQ